MDLRIHGNDAVAVRLHVCRDAMARPQRTVRESHDRNSTGMLQQVSDGIRLWQGSHAGDCSATPARNASPSLSRERSGTFFASFAESLAHFAVKDFDLDWR